MKNLFKQLNALLPKSESVYYMKYLIALLIAFFLPIAIGFSTIADSKKIIEAVDLLAADFTAVSTLQKVLGIGALLAVKFTVKKGLKYCTDYLLSVSSKAFLQVIKKWLLQKRADLRTKTVSQNLQKHYARFVDRVGASLLRQFYESIPSLVILVAVISMMMRTDVFLSGLTISLVLLVSLAAYIKTQYTVCGQKPLNTRRMEQFVKAFKHTLSFLEFAAVIVIGLIGSILIFQGHTSVGTIAGFTFFLHLLLPIVFKLTAAALILNVALHSLPVKLPSIKKSDRLFR